MTFALVFPLIMGVLAVFVWRTRGKLLPVLCDYPVTTTGHLAATVCMASGSVVASTIRVRPAVEAVRYVS